MRRAGADAGAPVVAAGARLCHPGAARRGRYGGAPRAEGGAERGAQGGVQVQVRDDRRGVSEHP